MASGSPQAVTLFDSEILSAQSTLKVSGLQQQRKGKKWKLEEDEQLRTAIQTWGEKRWRVIAEHVLGRTSIQCLHRWTKILKPGLIKGAWRPEEDLLLREWVQLHGPRSWAKCALMITGRNGKQCRERWNNGLDPSLTRGKWTSEEDIQIFHLHFLHGPKWSLIASIMSGRYPPVRSENSIKNRFYSNFRKLGKCTKKQAQRAEEKDACRPNPSCGYERTHRKTIACFGAMLFSAVELSKAIATDVTVPVLFTKVP